MEGSGQWRNRDEQGPHMLRLWAFGRAGRWVLVAAVVVLAGLVPSAPDPIRAGLFALVCSVAVWRFAWSRVDVTEDAIVYIGFLRNRRFAWTEIAGFTTSTDGIEVVTTAGKGTWLMPTKREAFTSRRMSNKAEALLARMIQYSPDPSEYEPVGDSE